MFRIVLAALTAFSATSMFLACSAPSPTTTLTVYSGRGKVLVEPLIEAFEKRSGIDVVVRYGGSAQLAATVLEEGASTSADVYYGQDAGALGALAQAGRLQKLPESVLEKVDRRFRARDGRWIGASGRARVLIYNTRVFSAENLPDSVLELTEPRFRGRVGWAPMNRSFQAFVTAMRLVEGEEATRIWLEDMLHNEVKAYRDNPPLFDAVLRGEIDVGLTNHYYLLRFLDESTEDLPVRNYSPRGGGAGALVNIAGVGILDSTSRNDAARAFVDYLLSDEAQTYFATKTFEYPLVRGVGADTLDTLKPLSEIRAPDIDLGRLDDLDGTLQLLQAVGAF